MLAKEMARRAGVEPTFMIYLTKRAMQHFSQGQITVLFPVVKEKFPASFKYSRTHEPVFTKRKYIFTLKSESLLNSYSELKGLRVGVTRGFSYSKELTAYSNSLGENHVELFKVNDDAIGARMLLVGRIDAFLAEETSGKKAFQNLDSIGLVQYDQASPVGVQDVFFAVN